MEEEEEGKKGVSVVIGGENGVGENGISKSDGLG